MPGYQNEVHTEVQETEKNDNSTSNPSQFVLERRRRESSYTDTLDDPHRYMELIKKTLGSTGEDEEQLL